MRAVVYGSPMGLAVDGAPSWSVKYILRHVWTHGAFCRGVYTPQVNPDPVHPTAVTRARARARYCAQLLLWTAENRECEQPIATHLYDAWQAALQNLVQILPAEGVECLATFAGVMLSYGQVTLKSGERSWDGRGRCPFLERRCT